MPTGYKSKKVAAPPPVYAWRFRSSQAHAGTVVDYQTILLEDGTLKCNCPGWIFKKKDKPRGCTHTGMVEEEAKQVFEKWKAGAELDLFVEDSTSSVTVNAGAAQAKAKSSTDTIKYGRYVDLD